MQILNRYRNLPLRPLDNMELYAELLAAESHVHTLDLFAEKYVRPYNGMHTSYSVKAYTDSGQYSLDKQALYDLRTVVDPVVEKLCAWYEKKYRGKFKCVYADVSTLKPNDVIDWHVDNYVFHSLAHRIHIPLQTGIGCDMKWFENDKTIEYHLHAYEPVEIDNLMFHSVANKSDVDRIHLMFDIMSVSVYDEYKKANPVGFKKIVSTVVNDNFNSYKKANHVSS